MFFFVVEMGLHFPASSVWFPDGIYLRWADGHILMTKNLKWCSVCKGKVVGLMKTTTKMCVCVCMWGTFISSTQARWKSTNIIFIFSTTNLLDCPIEGYANVLELFHSTTGAATIGYTSASTWARCWLMVGMPSWSRNLLRTTSQKS